MAASSIEHSGAWRCPWILGRTRCRRGAPVSCRGLETSRSGRAPSRSPCTSRRCSPPLALGRRVIRPQASPVIHPRKRLPAPHRAQCPCRARSAWSLSASVPRGSGSASASRFTLVRRKTAPSRPVARSRLPSFAQLGLAKAGCFSGQLGNGGSRHWHRGGATAGILFWMLPEPDANTQPTARVMPRLTPEVAGLDVLGRF